MAERMFDLKQLFSDVNDLRDTEVATDPETEAGGDGAQEALEYPLD